MSRPEGPRSRKLRGELELVEKRLEELEERLEGWWELKGNLEQRTVAKAFVGREGKVVGTVLCSRLPFSSHQPSSRSSSSFSRFSTSSSSPRSFLLRGPSGLDNRPDI
ncbi:hypothetical protein DRO32_05390, partial [Candidatus Bathyarchaeota archaeon]